MEKEILPNLEMNSNEILEKAKASLREVGQFVINWRRPDEPDVDIDSIKEIFKLNIDFVRARCQACNSYHYIFVKTGKEINRDELCLCNNCSTLLLLLVVFKAPEEKITEWLKSWGEVNPLNILKEAMSKD